MKPKIILTFLFLASLTLLPKDKAAYSFAEIRYVSKTGTSTPPYITWETASDSIQKAINICNDGDTVVVANGIYKETLVIENEITLLGSSMDSCIIDGTGLNGIGGGFSGEGITIKANNYLNMQNFYVKGKAIEPLTTVIASWDNSFDGKNLKIENANSGIGVLEGATKGTTIENCFINNVNSCIVTGSHFNQDTFKIYNNVLLNNQSDGKGINTEGGIHYIYNNIILGLHPYLFSGIDLSLDNYSEVKNNLVANYQVNNYDGGDYINGAVVENNVFLQNNNNYRNNANILISNTDKSIVKNNVIAYAKRNGIQSGSRAVIDYNLFWRNVSAANTSVNLRENNLFADPMFVKDTIPTEKSDFDFHLQKHSPAIDTGDPDILDVDGSRSDMGMYGGPLGQKYTYQDLAPRNPQNVIAVFENGLINLKWNKNSESDLYRYRIYRDTIPGFIYDTTKIIAVTADTFYNDNTSNFMASSYYYKVTAIDSAYNQSPASEEIKIIVTGLGEMPPEIIEDYKLMQNYPNPFNPSTKITYRLKEPGYVKLMVYNILGEIVEVLVNGYREKGLYEAEFTSREGYLESTKGLYPEHPTFYGDTASGIYLYRIEVTGKGNIPAYSDMKKMMLVK